MDSNLENNINKIKGNEINFDKYNELNNESNNDNISIEIDPELYKLIKEKIAGKDIMEYIAKLLIITGLWKSL